MLIEIKGIFQIVYRPRPQISQYNYGVFAPSPQTISSTQTLEGSVRRARVRFGHRSIGELASGRVDQATILSMRPLRLREYLSHS